MNTSALPFLPCVVRVTPVPSVPVLLLPELSATVVPELSLNAYAATSPDVCEWATGVKKIDEARIARTASARIAAGLRSRARPSERTRDSLRQFEFVRLKCSGY